MNDNFSLHSKLTSEQRDQLIARLRQLNANKAHRDTDAARASEPFPLTEVQQVYWLGETGHFDLSADGTNIYIELQLSVNHVDFLPKIDFAFQHLIERHDMLRAVIQWDGRQRILSDTPGTGISIVDLREFALDDVAKHLESCASSLKYAPVEIEEWPLFKVIVSILNDAELVLQIRFSPLLIDGLGRHILTKEMLSLLLDPAKPLEPLRYTYRDYVIEQSRHGSTQYGTARQYWMSRLPQLPEGARFPLQKPISPDTKSILVTRPVALLPPQLWASLKKTAISYGITPSSLIVCALAETLCTWSRNSQFTIGLVSTYRQPVHPDINKVVGNFTTIYLLAVDSMSGSFEQRCRGLHEQLIESINMCAFTGFEVLRERNKLTGGTTRAAMPVLINCLIEYIHPSHDRINVSNRYNAAFEGIRERHFQLCPPQVLLGPNIKETAQGALQCEWRAVEHVFTPGILEQMLTAFQKMVYRLATEPGSWREHRNETAKSLFERPVTVMHSLSQRKSTENSTLIELFERTVKQYGTRRSIVCYDGFSLTYKELYRCVHDIAEALIDFGICPGDIVQVDVVNCWKHVAACLAAMKCRAIYGSGSLDAKKDLDPFFANRCIVKITDLPDVTMNVICSDMYVSWSSHPSTGLPRNSRILPYIETLNNIAYINNDIDLNVIPVTHTDIIATVEDLVNYFELDQHDISMPISPLGSELSLFDLFGMFAVGGSVVLPKSSHAISTEEIIALTREHSVTFWNAVPVVIERLVNLLENPQIPWLSSVRFVMMSKWRMPSLLRDRIRRLNAATRVAYLVNVPELGIWSAVRDIEHNYLYSEPITIDRPIGGRSPVIVNELGEDCPDWVCGRLHFATAMNSDDLPDKLPSQYVSPGFEEKLTVTNMSARFTSEGRFDILAYGPDRETTQYGYQFDLITVEIALEQVPGVRHAFVVQKNEDDHRSLRAYLLVNNHEDISNELVSRALIEYLPYYMVPSEYITLLELPIKNNERVDISQVGEGEQKPVSLRGTDTSSEYPVEIVKTVSEMWCSMTDEPPCHIDDNLFACGGNSFTCVCLLNSIRNVYQVNIDLSEFLINPTLNFLAGRVSAAIGQRLHAH